MALFHRIAITALLLALPGGTAFAQMDQPRTGFYADPVMADPSPSAAHVFPAAEATAYVATVLPARAQHEPACSAQNPCAAITPPARG